MNSKKLLLLALLVLCSLPIIGSVEANPVVFAPYPNAPVSTQPSITINSPIESATYNSSSDIELNFTVTKPDNWTYTFTDSLNTQGQSQPLYLIFGRITNVYYTVDGGTKNSLVVNDSDSYVSTNYPAQIFNFNANLSLTKGQHSIKVGVESTAYYVNESVPPSSTDMNTISDPVTFTVKSNEQLQGNMDNPINAYSTQILIVAASVVVCFGVGLLVLWRRRKPMRC